MNLNKSVLDNFLRYVVVDSQSDPHFSGEKVPTTECQWDLLKMLEKELKDLGLKKVLLHEKGYLIATLEGNSDLPSVSFMAHVDTASDVQGNGVKPQIITNYDGKDITLKNGLQIKSETDKYLKSYIGETLIVTDGTTLLGGDDKAGIAEIMTAVEYLVKNPEIKHPDIEIIFTTDEETGCGMDNFPYDAIKSKACYTLDGGPRYEVNTECFNAATVKVKFHGVSIHLGSARGKMVNAITLGAKYIDFINQAESPEATDARYGFYCCLEFKGNGVEAEATIFLRDFDIKNIDRRYDALKRLGDSLQAMYPGSRIEVEGKVGYKNMAESAKKNPKAVDLMYKAGKNLGMPLYEELIRGGTDGADLAENGIVCPNIFVGSHNLHSLKEWAALPAMVDATKLIIEIIKIWE